MSDDDDAKYVIVHERKHTNHLITCESVNIEETINKKYCKHLKNEEHFVIHLLFLVRV
jgi:hypothetical protein